jgi:hypothetical protein
MKLPVNMTIFSGPYEDHAAIIAIRMNERHISISNPNVVDLKDAHE